MVVRINPFLVVFAYAITTVHCGTVTTTSQSIVGIASKKVILTWNLAHTADEKLVVLEVYAGTHTKEITAGVISPTVRDRGSELFGNRIIPAYNEQTKVYTITLTNISYTDSTSFQLRASFANGDRLNKKNSTILLTVEGGPNVIKNLQPNYTYVEKQMLELFVELSGNPMPQITWSFKLNSGTTSNSTLNETLKIYQYKYVVPTLTSVHCGQTLSYEATGYGQQINGETKIYVSFTPSQVSINSFHKEKDKRCPAVYWNALTDTGNCKVEYIIEITNGTGKFNFTAGSNTQSTYTTCDVINPKSVMMWAKFDGKTSQPSNKFNFSASPEKSTQAPGTSSNKESGSDVGIIIGAAIGGVIVVVIIIVIVIFVMKKKKRRTHGNSEVEMRIRDWGEQPRAENLYSRYPEPVNGARSRENNPDQVIYSQLGPGGGRAGPRPAPPAASNYAEVKVDELGYPMCGNPEEDHSRDSARKDDDEDDEDEADNYEEYGVIV